MSQLHLLLVEDDLGDQGVFSDTVKRYIREKNREIRVTKVATPQEAEQNLSNEIDAAIIDLKLGNDAAGGLKIIEDVRSKWRIPVAVFTATPTNLDDTTGLIKVYKKGETEYGEVIDRLLEVYDTGVTRIFGGRGLIEKEMDRVFWRAVLPSIQSWVRHQKDGRSTEVALLRFAISHLAEFLSSDADAYFDEEFFITPPEKMATSPLFRQLRTGSIVKKKDSDQRYLVLSPACDLAVHENSIKTDRILVSVIEGLNHFAVEKGRKMYNTQVPEDVEEAKKAQETKLQGAVLLKRLCSNSHCQFLHFLPPTEEFSGGLVNFRHLEVWKPSDFDAKFEYPLLQIAPLFIKDIVSRFSSYYARQGQPDLDFDRLVARLAK